ANRSGVCDCRLWGVAGSGENGGKCGREWLQGLAGNTGLAMKVLVGYEFLKLTQTVLEGYMGVMVSVAMIGALRQMKNQQTMASCSDSNVSMPPSPVHDRYQSGKGYHAVPPLYTGTFMPFKSDLVFHDASTINETVPTALHVEPSPIKLKKDLSKTNRPSAPIIEDWVSNSEDEFECEPMHTQKAPSFVQPYEHIKTPRPSVEHPIPAATFKKAFPKTRDCDYYEKKMVQKPVRNHAMRGTHQHYARMTHPNPHRHVVPTAVLTRSRLVPLTAAIPVTIIVPHINVTRPRPAKTIVNKPHSPLRRPINHRPSPKPRNVIPTVVLTRSRLVPLTATRPVSIGVLHINVTRPRPAKTIVNKPHSPLRMPINHRPSPKPSNFPHKVTTLKALQVNAIKGVKENWGNPQHALKDKRVIDSGFYRHMTGNISYLSDFKAINGGYVAFGGNPKGGKITGKDTECIILSSDFKLPDDNHVLLRVLRENNMYNVDLKNIVPLGDLTCLFAKATLDESNLWHRRLCHINFKIINKLVNGNLVRGLPSKVFKNNHTCVTCKKGKQHRASCKSKPVSSVSQPLQRLHMDLFRPTFMKSLNKKSYCLIVTDDYSRFSWVFFLATKDETSTILKTFITGIENQINLKVKIIKSDNGTEFKNQDLNQFCGMKGIKREFSIARTPQRNGIAERKNKTLIEAARTILADSLLPI
nr:putative ribonuclease H-like domain-containing protein [Tanacetum cinerariifolium]